MSPWSRLTLVGAALVVAAACSSPAPSPSPQEAASHSGHGESPGGAAERTVLLGNLGSFGRTIETSSPEAQQFFNEGLTLLYGFNHEEAYRSFARAAALDNQAPMPHWGMALALGTNINDPAPTERIAKAYTHLAAAAARAKNGSEVEQALIAALAKRYVEKPEGDQLPRERAYSAAMAENAKRFPDDPDVNTLYAESLMNLRPWRLYDKDGKPEEGTDTVVAALEHVMAANPTHPGANHYYIHAVEASSTPGRATTQAERLESLVPGAGHLVHMPAHIYIRTGQYARSAQSNAAAARVDEQYFKKAGQQGLYPVMYYGHNLQFESAAAMFAGRHEQAARSARQTVALVDPVADEMAMAEPYAVQDGWVALRFGRWEDALRVKIPGSGRAIQTALAHYVRGAALAEQRKVGEAEAARTAMAAAIDRVAEDVMISAGNSGRALLAVASGDLDGRIAWAKHDTAAAVAAFTRAVDAEDRLSYNEPPDWLLPERERLGAVLLAAGRAVNAESVFRKDLERNVGNPRSLFGLWKALDAQKKPGAVEARKAFEAAWSGADVTLGPDLFGAPR
jgi:hypothetical protein